MKQCLYIKVCVLVVVGSMDFVYYFFLNFFFFCFVEWYKSITGTYLSYGCQAQDIFQALSTCFLVGSFFFIGNSRFSRQCSWEEHCLDSMIQTNFWSNSLHQHLRMTPLANNLGFFFCINNLFFSVLILEFWFLNRDLI